jgi:hypothetical protein
LHLSNCTGEQWIAGATGTAVDGWSHIVHDILLLLP